MNIVEQVTITNLWGHNKVEFIVRPDVNFLIGPNGSGKTTVINLVVAALAGDFRSLIETPFSSILITLKEVSGSKKPSIYVEKQIGKDKRATSILYKVRDSASAKWDEYALEDIDEFIRSRYLMQKRRYTPGMVQDISGLKKRLRSFYNLTWLSIYRAKSFYHQEDEETYESTIDHKLTELSNEFVRFFSAQSQAASTEMSKFQEQIFLSLLQEEHNEAHLFKALGQMDFEKEKALLIDIYNELNVDQDIFIKTVNDHFSKLKKAYLNLEAGKKIDTKDFAVLITALRVHHIVQEWTELMRTQVKIYEPQKTFLEIINELMPNKVFSINNKNELVVQIQNGPSLRLQELSSGEKQMLIILGEALLQQKIPSIYIADEPELSLHVEWQQSLITNLLRINPGGQIIFATHSPDIVSTYGFGVLHAHEVMN